MIKDIQWESGALIITDDGGNSKRIQIAEVLGGTYTPGGITVPDLPIGSLSLLTKLAEVVTIIVKTLIERDILDEDFEEDYDLSYVQETLEDDLEAAW